MRALLKFRTAQPGSCFNYAQTCVKLSVRAMSSTPGAVTGGPMNGNAYFARASENATIPRYASEFAAGMDLCSCEDVTIPPKNKALINTGLKVAIPSGHYGRVAPRSGLAVKNFIDVGAGVIDEDYRGLVKVLLFNFDDNEFQVKKGDRIAQLVIEKILRPQIHEVPEDQLGSTGRGEGGFGSTGV